MGTQTYEIPDGAKEWLRSGRRGLSSEQIFEQMTGLPLTKMRDFGPHHPHDPSDFARCQLLLEDAPEFKERLEEMKDVSEHWAVLVENWSRILSTMEEENPNWRNFEGRAPQAYQLIKELVP